jgi:iron complex transport system ATP-binding protein
MRIKWRWQVNANGCGCRAAAIRWHNQLSRATPRGSGDIFSATDLGLKVQLTVLETVMLGRLDKLGWSLNRLDVEAAEKAMRAVGIIELSTRRVDTLSGGQQQLVLIAQRLIRSPSILLLDEPTSALDLRRQLLVLDILKSYAHDSGAVVVVVMHDLSLASRYCENLLVLQGGRAATVGPPSEVLNEDLIRSVYGVESEILLTSTGTPVIAPISAYRIASADV